MVSVLYLFRVLEVSRTDVVVVDPTHPESSSKHTADCEQSKNGETAHAESINQSTSGWQNNVIPLIYLHEKIVKFS